MFPDLTTDDVFHIETKRLWLRWPRLADAAAITRLAGEKQVAEMTGRIPHPYPPAEAERYALWARERNLSGSDLIMAIAQKNNPGELIGTVGIEKKRSGDLVLGYWLGVPYWGKGFATEAAHALIDTSFALTTASEIIAGARTINPASRNVLQKCGFQFEGQGMIETAVRGSVAVEHFRLTRRNWESLKDWREPRYVREEAAAG